MSNNLCILPPKCQSSDIVEGGYCNPESLKDKEKYVYNEIPVNERGSNNNKCLADDPTGMSILEDSDFVHDKDKCYLHPVTFDKFDMKQKNFTNEINELICVDSSGNPHNPKNKDPNSTESFPYGYNKCPVDTEESKCVTDSDCYGKFNNYCATKSSNFIPTLERVTSIPYQDEKNESLSDSKEDVFSTDPIIYQFRIKDENGRYGPLKFPVTEGIYNDEKKYEKYIFYRETPYNPPKENYDSTPFRFSYVNGGTQTNKNDARGISKAFFPFFFFIKKTNSIDKDENGNEIIKITEDQMSPVTEEVVAEFQKNRTKFLKKNDKKIPVMEYVRENGNMIPDTWSQGDIDLLNIEFNKAPEDSPIRTLITYLLSEIKVGDIKKRLSGYMTTDQIVYKEKQKEDENGNPIFLKEYYYDFFKRLDYAALRKEDVKRILKSRLGVDPKVNPIPFAKEYIYKVITEDVRNSYGVELLPIETQYDYDNHVIPSSKGTVFVKKIKLAAGSVCVKPRHPLHKDDVVEGVCKCENKFTPYGVCKRTKFTESDINIGNDSIAEGTAYVKSDRRRKHNCLSNDGMWTPYTDCVSGFENVENVESFKIIEGFEESETNQQPVPKSNCTKNVIYHADGRISYQ